MRGIGRWTGVAGVLAVLLLATLTTAPVARAEDNGVGTLPAMGWSTWSFLRHDPTEANVEAQAKAMVTDGLAKVGYDYVNLDDFWYRCPGPQGPAVNQYGQWAINTTRFPAHDGVNGIEATADYVHSLGLKFGIYVTPGISKQAVARNTKIQGTDDTADEIATTTPENNYNCGGMVGIDYSKPGAQQFINAWADRLASWGVDYVKIDGVGSFDIPDVTAWSQALRQTGRPIHLELSNSLAIADASTWQQYSNGWRTGNDIECYCSDSSFPLTDWANVASRFDQVAAWAPYGEPGAYNDYDSIEVGNGSGDGLTPAERQTQLSLWSLASSPLLLGTDLTHLVAPDRSYLLNRGVIAVDQTGIDATRISDTADAQVFAKTETSGAVDVGLFNTGPSTETVSTTTAALGLTAGEDYAARNLWTHGVKDTTGQISEQVPSHGVALLRLTPAGTGVAPLTSVNVSGPSQATAGSTVTETVSFSDDGAEPVQNASVTLDSTSGATVAAPTTVSLGTVDAGQTVTASFTVAIASSRALFDQRTLHAVTSYGYGAMTRQIHTPVTISVAGPPVQAPFETYSSATDFPAVFSQVGDRFGIQGAGTDVYSGNDDYSAIYQPGAVNSTSTVSVEVTAEHDLTGYAKAGIMVRNDIAGAGTTPEGVILFTSPAGGIQMEWDDNGGLYIDNVTPANGTTLVNPPVYLKLVRDGSTYTGYYSTDDTTWTQVGSETVPGQAATQDAGMFVVSGSTGNPGTATFGGFAVH